MSSACIVVERSIDPGTGGEEEEEIKGDGGGVGGWWFDAHKVINKFGGPPLSLEKQSWVLGTPVARPVSGNEMRNGCGFGIAGASRLVFCPSVRFRTGRGLK